MINRFAGAALALTLVSAPVGVAAQSQAMVVGSPASNVLRAGTQVQLQTITELTTEGKHLRVGDRFNMEVTEPVTVGGQVVVPVGSRAVGEITTVRNKGMWGKSGGLTARVLYVEANGRQIRCSGAFDDKGVTGTGGVVAAVVFVPVVGFFVTGTSARIAPKSHVTGFLDEDVQVAFAVAPSVAPILVAAPAVVAAAPVASPVVPAGQKPALGPPAPASTVHPSIVPVSAAMPKTS